MNDREERKRLGQVEKVYRYLDEEARALFEVVRFEGKQFRFRQPDPAAAGGWRWDMRGVPVILYRLPEMVEAVSAGQRVFVVDGEKDADRLAEEGLAATTAPGGMGRWRPDLAQCLRGARVVVLPDNDFAGREGALEIARSLDGVAEEVRILELPGLSPKGDVSDWLAAGGDRARLLRLAEQARVYGAAPPSAAAGQERSGYPLTDLGNAERLVNRHGHDLRFLFATPGRESGRGKWLIRVEGGWRVDEDEEIWRRATETIRAGIHEEITREGDPDRRSALARHQERSESYGHLRAMIRLARQQLVYRPEDGEIAFSGDGEFD